MRVYFFFAWYDFWIGFFYDRAKRILYFCPLPCCVFQITFGSVAMYNPGQVPVRLPFKKMPPVPPAPPAPTNHMIPKWEWDLLQPVASQILVAHVSRFSVSNDALRTLLKFIKEGGAEDLDGELVKEFCHELLEAANVEDMNGCRLCGG